MKFPIQFKVLKYGWYIVYTEGFTGYNFWTTVKPALSGHSKRTTKIGFRYQLLLNAGQKYCRMLPLKHSAILLTFIKLPISIKTIILFILSGRLRQVLLYISILLLIYFS